MFDSTVSFDDIADDVADGVSHADCVVVDDDRRQAQVDEAVAFLESVLVEAEAAVECGPQDLAYPVAFAAPKAVGLLESAERLVRLAAVVRVDAIGAVDAARAHYSHGHTSAHAMARHLGRLSGGESARADKIRRMIAGCDHIAAAWRAGELSVDQAGVLARAFAIPRVRNAFVERQAWFVKLSAKPFKAFERRVGDWVSLADQNGPAPRPERAHENRDVSLVQDHFTKQWTLRGTFGSLQGATLRRALDAYTSAERLADWDSARDIHGDDACRDNLARTEPQRRADALEQIITDAIANPERTVPIETCHDIVWSQESFEHSFRRFLGENPEPVDIDQHCCHTLDGHSLDPDTAFADAILSKWRRLVVTAEGITLDASAKQRFYTGLARLGVQINFDSCIWPGCDLPPSVCQIDHRESASRGGKTTQRNGGPACERHNRLKEAGYTVTRARDGTIHIRTPHGDLIPQ